MKIPKRVAEAISDTTAAATTTHKRELILTAVDSKPDDVPAPDRLSRVGDLDETMATSARNDTRTQEGISTPQEHPVANGGKERCYPPETSQALADVTTLFRREECSVLTLFRFGHFISYI